MTFKISTLSGKIKIVTGLHIGSGNTEMHIGGTDNPVIKNPVTNEPYIPGSSLKGKMRSLLELYTGSTNDKQANIVAKLFGIRAEDKESDVKKIKTARLSFWDCFFSDAWREKIKKEQISFTEVKMENTIDRFRGTAKNPRNTERVLPDSEFGFKLSVKVFDNENLLDEILGTMKLLEMDSLGGSGSRGYGKIKFLDLMFDGDANTQSKFDAIKPFDGKGFIKENS